MWNPFTVMAGALVLMLLVGLVTVVFMLPDAISKYLSKKSRQLDMPLPVPDSDEAAVRMLGESLRRAEVSVETTDQLLAAFWAANAEDRRALAHLVAGILAPRVEEEALLPPYQRWRSRRRRLAQGRAEEEPWLRSILRSLPATSEPSYEAEEKLPTSTAIRKEPKP